MNCELCGYFTSVKYDWKRHINSKKHIRNIGSSEENDESLVDNAYTCVVCSLQFPKKYNYTKHLSSKKHLFQCGNKLHLVNSGVAKKQLELEEKKLILKFEETKLAMELEEKKLLLEEKRLTTLSNNTTINHIQNINTTNTMNVDNTVNNNSNNTNFNLNIFLNEDCKDALNITDFINSISLTIADLEQTTRLGYTEGITKIIVDRIKEIGVNKRPYHCTDLKREIVYIKDEDLWEKEQNDKPRMKKMISNIIHKNIEQLTDWKDAHPGCMDLSDPKGEEYLQMMIEANGGSDRNRKEDKILKNVIQVANIGE